MKNDLALRKDIEDELEWEPCVNAAQIGVEVKNGIVTLSGTVLSFAEKAHAESAVQRVSGVKGLTLDLHVKVPGDWRRSDVDIAEAAVNALEWDSFAPRNNIQVMVENGCITLTGNVSSRYQSDGAYNAVKMLVGVTNVINQIVVNSPISTTEVKSKIEAALRRQATQDAQDINVSVDGSRVTLRGKVYSWWERCRAVNAAWAAPGVTQVVDQMAVI